MEEQNRGRVVLFQLKQLLTSKVKCNDKHQARCARVHSVCQGYLQRDYVQGMLCTLSAAHEQIIQGMHWTNIHLKCFKSCYIFVLYHLQKLKQMDPCLAKLVTPYSCKLSLCVIIAITLVPWSF